MLLENEKIAIRRHLNIAFAGLPGLNQTTGLRAVTRAGQLELYMNGIGPGEETVIVGAPYGSMLVYATRSVGDVLGVIINGGAPVTYTVTASDVASPWPQQAIAVNFSTVVNNASTGVIAAAAAPPTAYPVNSNFGGYPQAAEIFMRRADRQVFTAAITGPGFQLAANGSALPFPQLASDPGTGVIVTVAGMLPICNYLQTAYFGAEARLSFDQAGASSTGQVIFRKAELRQRRYMYLQTVREMSVLLGFSLGTNMDMGLRG